MGITGKDKNNLDKSLKELNLSNEETDKFAKAFKDPEFIKLFEEYAKEVSDPKVKAETDMYLRQLEMEGRVEEVYGKGSQLILPMPEFVVKTQHVGDASKVFINICSCEKVAKASLKSAVDASGHKGSHFDMPLCLGPKKTGEDKSGAPCTVWDFVVNPETLNMADEKPAIKRVMIETAMENIEKNNKEVQLFRKYKLPKMHYKGTEACPTPHALAMRGEGGTSENGRVKPTGAPAVTPLGTSPPAGTTPSDSAPPASDKQTPPQGADDVARSSFSFKAAAAAAKPARKADKIKEPTQAGYQHPGGEVTPKWEIIHRGQIDLSEAWGDAGRGMAMNTTHPKELVIRITLPGTTSVSCVQLDVSRADISVIVLGKFMLVTPLPFAVNSDLGKAKFDKARQQLEVVVPVIPPSLPPAHAMVSAMEPDAADCVAEEDADAAAAPVPASVKVQESGGSLVQVLRSEPKEEELPPAEGCSLAADGVGTPECLAAAREGLRTLTENERRWAELHPVGQEVDAAGSSSDSQEVEQQPGGASQTKAVVADLGRGVAPSAPAPIKLQPRLKSSLAEELD